MKTFTEYSVYLLILCVTSCTNHQDIPIRIAKYKGDKTCAISYTYDDGYKEHATLVVPEMEKRKFRGTFWINGISVSKDTTHMNWAELLDMVRSGHEVSNHSWSHPNFTQITLEEVRREIAKNDSIIFSELLVPAQTFCYPFNAMNEEVLKIASEGRIATRVKCYGIGTNSTPENLSEWVKWLLHTEDWGVAMIHGINHGYDAFTSASILWDHFDKVSAQTDRIWVGTFREVAAYIKERDNVAMEARKSGKTLTLMPKLLLDKDLFKEPLTMVIDKENIQNITVQQGGKSLPVQLSADKAMFDFKPAGGEIKITL